MLSAKDIMEIIPHRYPFLLLDQVTYLEPGILARGVKNISVNEPQFLGHFPGNPIMPGVLMVEALAQLGAVCILSVDEHKDKLAVFAGIDKVRFKKLVQPGDTLHLETQIIKIRGPVGKGIGIATVNGEIAVTGELMFALT